MFTEILNIVDLLGQPTVVIVTVGASLRLLRLLLRAHGLLLVFPFGGRATRASYTGPTQLAPP